MLKEIKEGQYPECGDNKVTVDTFSETLTCNNNSCGAYFKIWFARVFAGYRRINVGRDAQRFDPLFPATPVEEQKSEVDWDNVADLIAVMSRQDRYGRKKGGVIAFKEAVRKLLPQPEQDKGSGR